MGRTTIDSSRYEELLASLADNLYVFDRDVRYFFVTATAARAIGLVPEDVVGRTWRDLGLPAALMEPVERQVRSVFANGEILREETLFRGPDGPRHYEYVISPV